MKRAGVLFNASSMMEMFAAQIGNMTKLDTVAYKKAFDLWEEKVLPDVLVIDTSMAMYRTGDKYGLFIDKAVAKFGKENIIVIAGGLKGHAGDLHRMGFTVVQTPSSEWQPLIDALEKIT